jgi:hypothetical protein
MAFWQEIGEADRRELGLKKKPPESTGRLI